MVEVMEDILCRRHPVTLMAALIASRQVMTHSPLQVDHDKEEILWKRESEERRGGGKVGERRGR